MLGDDATNARQAEYMTMLDRALEDRKITGAEAESLVATASAWEMSRSEVLVAHRAYLASLVWEAQADDVITASERNDLEAVCDILDLNRAALEELLVRPAPAQDQPAVKNSGLSGKTVCFTGELESVMDGERVTREVAERLATAAGLVVKPSVTKKLDILVVADPQTQSGKARRAQECGVRIMAAPAFWKAIGVNVR